ncbi:hypothetical protein EAE99_009212 [Botrytis elliptica]|nr:hypothetical protein EAE99_009212 [Botrytis elliptica]
MPYFQERKNFVQETLKTKGETNCWCLNVDSRLEAMFADAPCALETGLERMNGTWMMDYRHFVVVDEDVGNGN